MTDNYKRYDLYFEVDTAYFPVINPDSIKESRWEDTYAHKSFRDAISDLEKILSRGSNVDMKGLWIDGAYGTGKSRLIWTLQNLLECSPEKFKAYFREYKFLRREKDLRDKLLAAKARKIVTVYRYGSGEIISTRNLINAVFDSMTAAFKKYDCKFIGAKTLRGRIAAWLEADVANLQLFDAKIKSPKYRGYFGGKSAEDVLDLLKNSTQSIDDLIDNILTLGEAEGIRAFEISIDDLKDWLTETIDANDLKAVVFLWDEFSDFFKKNRNNLGDFQKLVELCNSKPFYMVIATHEAQSLAIQGDKSFKIIYDRFFHRTITMPDNIAFELIGHALKIKSAGAEEWDYMLRALIDRVKESRRAVADFIKADDKVLNAILPIHPLAALMLKYISTYFASNQRSMFNFIKSDESDVAAFQKFIHTKTPQLGELLTIDYLWEFFYEKGSDEHTDELGRSNLNFVIAAILDTYPRHEKELSDVEKIILKTVLMMEAITRKSQKEKIKLLQPSAENLQLAFEGVDEYANAVQVARRLVDKKILYRQPGAEEIFAAAAVSGDQAVLDAKKREIVANFRLNEIVANVKWQDEFVLSPAQKLRFKFEPVILENFTRTINRITDESETFQMRGVICFAKDEAEQQKFNAKILEILRDKRYHKLVFINATENFFGIERFNRLVDYRTHEEYWRAKDTDLSKQNAEKAEDILREWNHAIADGNFLLYPAMKDSVAERKSVLCPSRKFLKDELDRNLLAIYPLSFDNANVPETVFLANNFRKNAYAGIKEEFYSAFNQRNVETLLREVWRREGKYWERQPTLGISKLKTKLDAFISQKIKDEVHVSFTEIFAFLLAEGFMPCNLYAFLTGFLLKEYAHEPYRYSIGIDGDEGGSLNVDKLADFIDDAIKQFPNRKNNYREKFIEVMSRSQREFMKFAHEIFGVDEDLSVEQGVQKIRNRMVQLGYPAWCYVDAAAASFKDFAENFSYVVNTKDKYNVAELAEKMGNFLSKNPSHINALKKFFTLATGKKSLEKFLREYDDGIIFDLAEKIGIKNVTDEVQKKISSGEALWLWDKETGAEEIRKLIVEYKIIAATNALGIECTSFNACLNEWIYKAQFIRVPCKIISECYPALKKFFELLADIVRRGEFSNNKREEFLAELEKNSVLIAAALESSWKILKEKFSPTLTGLNAEDVKNIVAKLPTNSFTDDRTNFIRNLTTAADELKKMRLNVQLSERWKKLTGSDSPRDWSKKNRTPILIMVPENNRDEVRKVFETIGSPYAAEDDIKSALNYLNSTPAYFKNLSNKEKIDEAFKREILCDAKVLFDDADDMRREIESQTSEEPYSWHVSAAVKKIVQEKSQVEYRSNSSEKVADKIRKMDNEHAKDYLIRLVKENYKIGIEILSEEV